MKIKIIASLLLALVLSFSGGAALADDIKDYPSCLKCGMDRQAFGYSRTVVADEEGHSAGFCSLTCALVVLDAPGAKIKSFMAADRDTRELVDGYKAFWVVGGSKPAVMSTRAKWAFATKGQAEKFVKEYGGKATDWQEALRAAREDAMEHKVKQ